MRNGALGPSMSAQGGGPALEKVGGCVGRQGWSEYRVWNVGSKGESLLWRMHG